MDAVATITIDKPAADVFRFLTDVGNMPKWVTGVNDAELLSDRIEQGAVFALDYAAGRRLVRLEIEVAEYVEDRVFAIRVVRGPFEFMGRIEVDSTGKGSCSVTNIINADPDSLSTTLAMVVFGPFLRRSFVKRLGRELEQLRDAMSSTSDV